jgi:hypothetical protein
VSCNSFLLLKNRKSIVGSIRNSGEFGIQANSVEILYRLYLWKKLDQTKLKKIFGEFFHDDKVIELFTNIRRNQSFIEVEEISFKILRTSEPF